MRSFFLKDKNILVLILLNAIVIFCSGFQLSPEIQSVLYLLDMLFTILFVVEAYAKIKTWGREKYFSMGWNVFDFILVLISVPSILVFIFDLNMTDISFLLIFRTLRVFKIFRFFNFIPGIGNLMKSIKAGFKASVMILIAFSVFLFVISILSNHIFNKSEVFNNPATSVYTMLQLISLEGWYEIPEAIIEDIPTASVFWTRLYFVLFLVVGGIFGLSFVDAVLVDSMVLDNTDELEEKVDELKKDMEEIKELLKNLEKPSEN